MAHRLDCIRLITHSKHWWLHTRSWLVQQVLGLTTTWTLLLLRWWTTRTAIGNKGRHVGLATNACLILGDNLAYSWWWEPNITVLLYHIACIIRYSRKWLIHGILGTCRCAISQTSSIWLQLLPILYHQVVVSTHQCYFFSSYFCLWCLLYKRRVEGWVNDRLPNRVFLLRHVIHINFVQILLLSLRNCYWIWLV